MRECRICLGGDDPETMVEPCRCRGTMAYIHPLCLENYIRHYPDGICRVCATPLLLASLNVYWLPGVVFTCMLYGISMSDAEVLAQLCMAICSGVILFNYAQALVYMTDVLWMSLGVFFLYLTAPPDFALNAIFIAGLLLYAMVVHVPFEYVTVLVILGIVGMYFLFVTYLAFMALAKYYGSAVAMTGLFLIFMFAIRTRPAVRIEP